MSERPGRSAPIILSGSPADLRSDAATLIRAAWRIDRTRFVGQIAYVGLTGLIGGFNLLLLVPIVNAVAGTDAGTALPLVGRADLASVPLVVLLGAFVVLSVCTALLQRGSAINASTFQPLLVDELRTQAFEAILAARWTFVLQRRRSDVLAIVTMGATRCGMAFQQLIRGAVSVVLALSTTVVSLVVAPAVTAIALVGMLGLALLQATVIRPSHQLGVAAGLRSRELQATMQDSLDSLRLVRAHDASTVWVDRLTRDFETNREVQIATTRRSADTSALSSVILAVAASILVLLAVQLDVPPASIVVVLLLLARLYRQVDGLGTTAAQLANSLPAVTDIAALTNEARDAVEVPSTTSDRPGTLSTDPELPLVELRHVAFTYPDSSHGVRDLTFTLPRGEITVLTGPSGAGKSTAADLVLGLLEPAGGELLVDGAPLTRSDLPWWRSHLAYVPQETVLVPRSIRENLVWSVPDGATDEECWAALDRAAAGFTRSLPDGLDTVLGDAGLRLSGGERQRLAIARALLRRPSLLVLDEATSSLDDETELAVIDLVTGLVPAVTVLVIAHRRSTVDAGHHVVRIADGRVVDAGAR